MAREGDERKDLIRGVFRFVGFGRWLALIASSVFWVFWLTVTIGMFVSIPPEAPVLFRVMLVGIGVVGTIVLGGTVIGLAFFNPLPSLRRSIDRPEQPDAGAKSAKVACGHCGFRMGPERNKCPGCGAPRR